MIEHFKKKWADEIVAHRETRLELKRSEERAFDLREKLYRYGLELESTLERVQELLLEVDSVKNNLERGKKRFEQTLKTDLVEETKSLFKRGES